jgi:transposase-like protein
MPISYARHQFPAVVIQHAVWLYVRFTLSYRDVEELLAERGLDVSYETIRRWVLKFGPAIARHLRRRRPQPTGHWHLDEMVVRIAGRHTVRPARSSTPSASRQPKTKPSPNTA